MATSDFQVLKLCMDHLANLESVVPRRRPPLSSHGPKSLLSLHVCPSFALSRQQQFVGSPSLPAYTFIGQETIFHYSIHPSIHHHPPSFFALLLRCTYCYYYYHLVNLVSSSTVPLLSQFRVYSSDQLPDNFPQLFLSQLHQQTVIPRHIRFMSYVRCGFILTYIQSIQ
jgi:hypothetical protein